MNGDQIIGHKPNNETHFHENNESKVPNANKISNNSLANFKLIFLSVNFSEKQWQHSFNLTWPNWTFASTET